MVFQDLSLFPGLSRPGNLIILISGLSMIFQGTYEPCNIFSPYQYCFQGTNDLHMVQLMLPPPYHLLHQNPEWFTF